VALTEQADYGGALKLLKEVLNREPQMAFAQYFIGKIQYLQKKYDQAEINVREAMEKDPRLLDALVLMINISIEQKKFDQAREALQRVREAMHNRMVTKFIDEQLSVLGS
jgi:tetratricopeptide (TPR) repeat protein